MRGSDEGSTQARRPVRVLSEQAALKIAAGEVIDRPASIVRELLDNAVDSGATRIRVEIEGGGIERIRVSDNGCGMSRDDLEQCALPHATSKITSEDDLLTLATLVFRGEALSSMAAVSCLEVTSGGFRLRSHKGRREIIPCATGEGLIAQTTALFEDFPARRRFLKRPFAEAALCKNVFQEKVLPCPAVEFSLYVDGEERLSVGKAATLRERFIEAMGLYSSGCLLYEIKGGDEAAGFTFTLVIGDPDLSRTSRKDIHIYVNGRRIQEYALVQAIVYGTQGYFPNGTFPVACLFVRMRADLVDFNIHPAKREVRFKDITPLHRAVSSSAHAFFNQYTVKSLALQNEQAVFASLEPLEDAEPTPPPTSASPERTMRFPQDPVRSLSFRGTLPSVSALVRPTPLLSPAASAASATAIADGTTASDVRYVGKTLGTFLLAERGGTLYIIDQHAACERMIYNQLMANAGERQPLLMPLVVQTDSDEEDEAIRALTGKLGEAGFEVHEAGLGQWEFTSVPLLWQGGEGELRDALLDKRVDPKSAVNCVAASCACRRAVMDGTVLDDDEAARIARGALTLPDPHCPHGRPVYTSITREQLFSLVKRT